MKPQFILFAMALFLGSVVEAQNVGIGTTTPNANAALEIKSNNKGLLMPRLSTTARNSMTNVAKGMLVFDSSYSSFYYHDGITWRPINDPNNDGQLTDYSSTPQDTTIGSGSNSVAQQSGVLYDDGGPAGNYSSNIASNFYIFKNDSTVGYKIIINELNLESPYDMVEIYFNDDRVNKQVFTGTQTGTYYFGSSPSASPLVIAFRSNAVNNLAGFKITWSLLTTKATLATAPPIYGWYFNPGKIAIRGGVNYHNYWATDSLGKFSFGFGENTFAKGRSSTAFGENVAATGDYSFASGRNTVASGFRSIAIGAESKAQTDASTALGVYNVASGGASTAIGFANRVSGSLSAAIGAQLVTKTDYSYAIGLYNDSTGINKLFEIGNGKSSSARSNAVTVLQNGNTGIGTIAPTTTLEVNGGFKTKYSGSVIKTVLAGTFFVDLNIPPLPAGWDFTNTLVMVSVADGEIGIIYRTKLTSISNIALVYEAKNTGPTRFNYIVFKL